MVSIPSTADTALFETSPDNNLGGNTDVPSGTTSSGFKSRGLFKFDLAGQIPTNATVTNVSLTLKVTRTSNGASNSTFLVRRVLRDWGEGSKTSSTGQPATAGEATWNARFAPSTLWNNPGASLGVDYSSTISASKFVSGLGSYTFTSTTALIADVQAWLNTPATNFGWLVLSQDEGVNSTARRFGSREDTTNAPVLVVQYTTSAPVPPQLTGVTLTNGSFRFEFTAEAGKTYTVESRGGLTSGSWTTFTNLAAQPVNTNLLILAPLSVSNGFYRVRTP